jgi:hypothetical protein
MTDHQNSSAGSASVIALKRKLEAFSKAELIEELMAALVELASISGARKQ